MEFKIEGMICGGCVKFVIKVIQLVDLIVKIDINFVQWMVKVEMIVILVVFWQVFEEVGYLVIVK